MKKALVALLFLVGCAPLPDVTPSPSVSVRPLPASPSPAASPSPSEALQPPLLPAAATQGLEPVPGLQPALRDREPWWANSGIGDNRLAYFASAEEASKLEPRLLASFQEKDYQNFLEGIPAVFSFEDHRVCVLRKTDSDFYRMFVLAPISGGKWPAPLAALKLPRVPLEGLKGKKTLVVLATGERLGEHLDHMMGQAGLVIEPTPSPTSQASGSPSPTPTSTPHT